MNKESLAAAVVCFAVSLGVVGAAAPASAQGVVISVPSGGDLQGAIDKAAPGDTIQLEPGGRYVGNFVLPNKSGSAIVTIRTAPDSRQPGDGVRVQPLHAPALALLRSNNTNPAITTASGAHHYRLMLLEFGGNDQGFGEIVRLGQADSSQSSVAQIPYSLVLDRLYVHGDPLVGQKRGIAVNSASTDIINCYISDIKAVGQDTQAIAVMNGPGPYLIENNYLEAAAENFLSGGVDPTIVNQTPSDITFRYNYLSKPVAWRDPIVPTPSRVAAVLSGAGGLAAGTYAYQVVAQRTVAPGTTASSAPSAAVSVTVTDGASAIAVSWVPVQSAINYLVYAKLPSGATQYWTTTSPSFIDNGTAGTVGTPRTATTWVVKNIFELKQARNVTVESNLMEFNWKAAQPGFAVVLTTRNSGGTCTWCAIENVTFRYNIVRHVGAAINVLGYDNIYPSGQAHGLKFVDNLFYDVSGTAWGGNGWLAQLGGKPADIVFDHNTIDHEGTSIVYAYGSATETITGFQFTNNLARHNNYGIFGASGQSFGLPTLNYYFPGAIVTGNVMAGGSASKYPAGNLFPTVATHVAQFTNPANGDYSLVAGSSYIGAGLDGRDLGANIAEIKKTLDIASSGTRIGSPIQIITTTLPPTTVGTPLDATLVATGGSGRYGWSSTGALPAGVQFNPSAGTLSGVPTEYGTWSIAVTAVDAIDPSQSATQQLTLSVSPVPVRISGASLPGAIVGRPATGAVYAAGGTGSYRWRVLSGALPQGMTLDVSAGTLSGTPTVAGAFAFTVEVSDVTYTNMTAQGSFSITVAPPVAIMTTVLDDATQGLPYAAVLQASGGSSSLNWKVTAGVLPPGLTLSADGRISGTPTASGSWTFDAVAIDSTSVSNASSATFTIAVRNGDIVLYARRTTALAGTWQVISDATAAGGARVGQPDAAAPKVTAPLAAPANYFELSFTPVAGRAYHLWIRGKAQNDSWANDSVYVQFSGSVTAAGQPTFRIGTTSAATVNLEDGLNMGVSGWGWQDNGYGVNVLGTPIYFDGTPQKLRIQTREDGFSIDQVVLSPATYFSKAPGTLKNDTTILAEFQGVQPPVNLAEVVMRASSVSGLAGKFQRFADATAAEGTALGTTDAGLAKIIAPLAAPADYVELTFQAQANSAYRLWMRGNAQNNSWANDSVYVQFSNSVDAAGTPVYRIGTTSGLIVNLEDGANVGVSGWGWQDDGYGVNVLGPLVYFGETGPQTIRVQVREDGYRFDQIVLSAQKYLTTAPGALKNDVTILK